MSLKVFHHGTMLFGSPDALIERLAANVRYSHGTEIPDPADYEILIAAAATREILEASPGLRAVIVPYAGPGEPTLELLGNYPGITLHNAPFNPIPTAETALALMLASAKFLARGDRMLRRNDWTLRYSDRPQLLLHGRTVLILGYGRIGRHLAPVCRALGMNVIGVRRTPRPEDTSDTFAEVYGIEQLPALLPRAEVLLIALPGTPETKGLIGEAELALLPDDAILVNVGRGPVVEEAPLYHALANRKLAAAGLDVWYRYPRTEAERTATAPSKFPFHELETVVLSPHRAGWLGPKDDTLMALLAVMLNEAAGGRPIPHRVDTERGY